MIRRPVPIVAALALLLAGCAGGGLRSVVPPATSAAAPIAPQSTNVNLFDATLWYGDGTSLLAVPLTAGGATAQVTAWNAGAVSPVHRAVTVAPDGTLYDLVQTNGGSAWRLQLYAPGSQGAAEPEQVISGTGSPQQVLIVGDGIDVLAATGAGSSTGSSTLSTFAYASGDNPRPIRTLALGAHVSDIASDRDDRLYVAHDNGPVTVYQPAASGAAAPVRTIRTGGVAIAALAVAADRTVYAEVASANTTTVYAYAAGSNGAAASRTIGPFARSSSGAATGGITVDVAGNLYVGFADASGHTRADVFGPTAAGAATPVRSIVTPSQHGFLTALAIGPRAIVPAASLYVASADLVNVFPTTASGTVSPSRTITGLYQAPSGTPPQYAQVSAIATAANGTLDVVQNYATPTTGGCRGIIESATAKGSSGVQGSFPCTESRGNAVARGINGEIVTLMLSASGYDADTVQRSLNGAIVGQFLIYGGNSHKAIAVAGDRHIWTAGRVELSTPSMAEVDEYAETGYQNGLPLHSYVVAGTPTSMAIAADGTVYVGSDIENYSKGTVSDVVYAFTPGQPDNTPPARSIGPFGDLVAAVATDAQNQLYVGLNPKASSGTQVQVFAPQATGQATPLRTLLNPISTSDTAGSTIVGLAIGSTSR